MMKKILMIIAFIFAATVTAQTQYENGMKKAFELWGAEKTTEAAQLFERIAAAEKGNWLPPYYAAMVTILDGFSIKDETVLTAKLTKAQQLLDEAMKISKDNPEIIIAQALLNTAYIAFDGQKYGMTLSGTNAQLYAKANELAPNNPRVVLSKAEWDMGAASFFGQSTAPFCKDVKRAVELFKAEKQTTQFYPYSGLERAEKIVEDCDIK